MNRAWATLKNSNSTKYRQGKVISNPHNKTLVVAVARQKHLSKYNLRQLDIKKYHVHDEENACDIGDKVLIQQSRPHSKTKHWEVAKILIKEPGSVFLRANPEYDRNSADIRKTRKELQAKATARSAVTAKEDDLIGQKAQKEKKESAKRSKTEIYLRNLMEKDLED